MIIDFQHHYLPEELLRKHGWEPGQTILWRERGQPKLTLRDGLHNVEEHFQNMDVAGIDMAVFSCFDHPLEDCRLINDRLGDLQKRYPKRIAGLVHVPPLGGKESLRELERGVRDLGLKGAYIDARVQEQPVDSPRLRDFYGKVQELAVPIFVHPSLLVTGFPALEAPSDMYRSLGREFELVTATTRFIMGGILEDFPELKIVIGHLGGGISAILERIDRGARLGAQGSRMRLSFHEYLSKLYFDMAGFEGGIKAVGCALAVLRPEQLVFATDYPQNFYGKPEKMKENAQKMGQYVQNVRGLSLPAKTKEGIFGETAARLLGLGRT